ncbi:MAG: hypothetical protein HWN68_03520 [Desulfobacterales bacterium]|nr:hypothetical protein [Desulfobacterales bacterium]
MKRACRIIPILLALLFATMGVCHAEEDSPVQVVELFSAYYGGANMDEIVDYTTEHFRANRPKSVWIVDTWKALQRIDYRRLHGSVIDSKLADDRAAVILDAKIGTAGGETKQKEIYYLIKEDQKWLIDQLRVADEEIDEEKTNL